MGLLLSLKIKRRNKMKQKQPSKQQTLQKKSLSLGKQRGCKNFSYKGV